MPIFRPLSSILLAVALNAALGPAAIPADAQPPDTALYWTDSGLQTISRSELDGTGGETIVSAGLDFPEGIVVLRDAGELWWADGGLGAILRSDLDGAGIDTVLAGLAAPAGIAVDTFHGKVYWSNVAVGTIARANLDGSGVEVVVPAFGHVRYLAIDPGGGKLYFTGEQNTKVQRANLDGTNVEDLAVGGNPLGIALDLGFQKVYWVSDGIHRANLDGSDPEEVLAVPAAGLAVDSFFGKIYWTSLASPYLRRANLDGSGVEDLVVTGPSVPRALALDVPPSTILASPSAGAEPSGLALGAPRPNPLRTSTALAWRGDGPVSLRVYDVAGRLVRRLVEPTAVSGSGPDGVVRWDGTDAAGRPVRAGVYFVELRSAAGGAAPAVSTRRLVILR